MILLACNPVIRDKGGGLRVQSHPQLRRPVCFPKAEKGNGGSYMPTTLDLIVVVMFVIFVYTMNINTQTETLKHQSQSI